MRELDCPVTGDAVESPGVGVFLHGCSPEMAGERCIGTLLRLGERCALMVPPGVQCRVCMPNGARVMAGDRIAQRISTQDAHEMPKTAARTLTAPCDGFLLLCNDAGKPLLLPGSEVSSGTVVAFLELMKIRMEITAEQPGTFVRYVGKDRSPVRRGEIIAEFC